MADYDAEDDIQRDLLMRCQGMQFATYRVKDFSSERKFSHRQHHMTMDNLVIAVLEDDGVQALYNALSHLTEGRKVPFNLHYCGYDVEVGVNSRGLTVFHVRVGELIVAVLGVEMSRLFCRLAREQAGRTEPDVVLDPA